MSQSDIVPKFEGSSLIQRVKTCSQILINELIQLYFTINNFVIHHWILKLKYMYLIEQKSASVHNTIVIFICFHLKKDYKQTIWELKWDY